nr:hypothetical protein Iba_chr02bCG16950 [Ipomoea batatas]
MTETCQERKEEIDVGLHIESECAAICGQRPTTKEHLEEGSSFRRRRKLIKKKNFDTEKIGARGILTWALEDTWPVSLYFYTLNQSLDTLYVISSLVFLKPSIFAEGSENVCYKFLLLRISGIPAF